MSYNKIYNVIQISYKTKKIVCISKLIEGWEDHMVAYQGHNQKDHDASLDTKKTYQAFVCP